MGALDTINRELHKVWPAWTAVEKIGEGTFGEVYRIVREGRFESALKIITIPPKQADEKALYAEGADAREVNSHFQELARQVQSEIELMESMKSALNVVSIEDHAVLQTGPSAWRIYIRMELLLSMGDYIRQAGRLPESEILKLGMDILSGLKACHSKNIIHRDIKPANIFRTQFGDYKLGDFGIARKLEGALASTRAGTPSFEAPEVAKGTPYDRTADIYALGMVLYIYLNRGRKPFLPLPPKPVSADETAAAQQLRFNGQPLPPPADASPALSSIILKACAYHPKDRYQTAEEMRRDLNRYSLSLSGEAEADPSPRGRSAPRPAASKRGGPRDNDSTVLMQDFQSERNTRGNHKKPLLFGAGGLALLLIILFAVLQPWKGQGDSTGGGGSAEAPVPTVTDTPVPTAAATPTPTATAAPTPTAADTPTPTATATPTPIPSKSPEQLKQTGDKYYKKRDYDEAVRWYRLAAEKGDAEAQYLLGNIFFHGVVVRQDYEEAAKWYQMAAAQGHTSAERQLERLDAALNEFAALAGAQKGDQITFGRFEQDNDTSDGEESIEWIVLDRQQDRGLVISRYGLETMKYKGSPISAEWHSSDVRSWLNGDFLDAAFTEEEQSRILSSNIKTNGAATMDKLFLLSKEEVVRYIPTVQDRICIPTIYSLDRGAVSLQSDETLSASWWLRSRGIDGLHVQYVGFDGKIVFNGALGDTTGCLVRPAMWIRLDE